VRTIKHPLSGALYDLQDDGRVRVASATGEVGIFDVHGVWQSGDLKQADPHLCLWIAGKEPTR
jgi:hypothetical protein